MRRTAIAGGATAAVAGVAALIFAVVGRPSLNGDVIHALIWGRDLASGSLPQYAEGPTPHPLTNVVAGALSILGPSGAFHASEVLALLFFAGLLVSVGVLGAALFSPAVGALAALLLATEYGTLWRAMSGFYDIPALALGVLALAAVVRRRPVALAAALLALAGLIRPEYWLYSMVLGATALVTRTGHERVLVATLCALPLILWVASDAVVTSEPLWSLTHTQALADEIGRRTGLSQAPAVYLEELRALTARVILALSAVGALLALAARRRSATVLLGVLAAGALTYAAIGIAQLSLIDRYLLPSSVAVTLFASYAALGWLDERERLPRSAWVGVACLSIGALLVTVPNRIDDVRRVRDDDRRRVAMLDDLRELTARLDGCRPLHAFYPRGVMRPTIAHALDLTPGAVLAFERAPATGAFIAPADARTAEAVRGSRTDRTDVGRLPGEPVTTTRHWRISRGRC